MNSKWKDVDKIVRTDAPYHKTRSRYLLLWVKFDNDVYIRQRLTSPVWVQLHNDMGIIL